MYSDFEYVEESLLIDDLVQLEFGLSKRASIFDELDLNSVGNAIKNFVHEHLKGSDEVPGGYFTSILNLMTPAVLMRVHPILGLLYLVGDHYGFGLTDMIQKVMEALKPKIDSGESISTSDVSSIGKSVLGLSSQASFIDLLETIKKEARFLQLEKIARRSRGSGFNTLQDAFKSFMGSGDNYSSVPGDIPFLFGDSQASILQRVFGSLFSKPVGGRTVKWLLSGFAIWIVKTVLAGAGLIALSEGVASLLHHPKKEPSHLEVHETSTESEPVPEKETSNTTILPTQESSSPVKSNKFWVVPLVGDGSIEDTLRIWILDLYPQLNSVPNIDQIIVHNSEFQHMVTLLSVPANKGKNSLVMPTQFSSRKEVVDQIIDSIKGDIK